MKHLFIIPLLLLATLVQACDGNAAVRFINMDIPGTYNLGTKGIWTITNTDGTIGIISPVKTVTDLTVQRNPNQVVGQVGKDTIRFTMKGKGKVLWEYFKGSEATGDPLWSGVKKRSEEIADTTHKDPRIGLKVPKKPKNNNGHGNNEDGVDTSNPGKSKKDQDTDPTVDDEKK